MQGKTLAMIIGHEGRTIDLLKVDIEGSEFSVRALTV